MISLYSVLKFPREKLPSWRTRSLPDRLLYAFEKKLFTDAEIQVKTQVFKVHKCILACVSSVFEKMFYGKNATPPPYVLDCVEPCGFQLLLRMVYQAAFRSKSRAKFHKQLFKFYNTKDVLLAYIAAEELEMPLIKNELMNALFVAPKKRIQPLCQRGFWTLLNLTQAFELREITMKLLTYAKLIAEKILEAEVSLPLTNIETIKLVFNIMNIPEYKIFECVARWCSRISDSPVTSISVKDLLACVNFRKLSPKEFYAVISKYEDLMSFRDALDIFMHLVDPMACSLPIWYSYDEPNSNAKDIGHLIGNKSDMKVKKTGLQGICLHKLRNHKFVDVYLSDNGTVKKMYPTQKLILALGTTVFEKLVCGHAPSDIIYMDATSEVLEKMLRYLYGSPLKVNSTSWISTLKTLDISLKYGCHDMKINTIAILKSTPLTPDIFWTLLSQNNIVRQCLLNMHVLFQFGQIYTENIFEHEMFLSAPKNYVIEILKSNCLNMSEHSILISVAKWLQKNCRDPLSESKELLKYIRFESLTTEDFHSFIKKYDKILSKKDTLDIFSYLSDKTSYKALPDWCYTGCLRGSLYQELTKIGTMKIIQDGKVLKGSQSFRAHYILRMVKQVQESQVQYLELAWKMNMKQRKIYSALKCNINISFSSPNVEFAFFGIDVHQHQRIMLPVFFQVTERIPEIKLDISIMFNNHHRLTFPDQRKLLFQNMEIEAATDVHCIYDAIVDNSTSEGVYIPKHLLTQHPKSVIPTKEWCK